MKPALFPIIPILPVALALAVSANGLAQEPKKEAPEKPKPAQPEKVEKAPATEPAKKPEASKPDAKPAESKPAEGGTVHKITKGEFEVKLSLDGTFEAVKQTPIALDPREWGDLTVVSVVDHGTVVKKGDLLVKLDTRDLEEQIADLERARPLEELNLKLAHQEFATLERTTPLSLEAARRAKMEGEQDMAYYEDTERAMEERNAKENVKRIEQNLAYNKEELDQLEKMYAADELTEETEEIILQRARNDVAYYEWMLEQTRARSERILNTSIPRQHLSQRKNVEQLEIAWRQAEQSLPETLRKKRLELEAQEIALKKSAEKLADLKADLADLTVKAPHDGVVYYGATSRGKWVTASQVERKLVPGGKLMADEVILTVVSPEALRIRASVGENRLRHLKKGVSGQAAPGFDPESEFPTAVETVSLVPFADGTYDATFTAPKGVEGGPAYYPGMTVKIRLDLFEAADALTAPKKAVHRDKDGHYVHLKDGSKRRIKVGQSNDDAYQVLEGLKEGDEIKVP